MKSHKLVLIVIAAFGVVFGMMDIYMNPNSPMGFINVCLYIIIAGIIIHRLNRKMKY